MTLSDFNSFNAFFEDNTKGAKERFDDIHSEFKKVFNRIIIDNCSFNFRSKQKGTAISLYLRATKYLYTMHNLALTGHVEEARILSRNIIELVILAYLISKSTDVFNLWEDCFSERMKRTTMDGTVNVEMMKDKKYKVNDIIKQNKNIMLDDPDAIILRRLRGQFSTYYSHENLFNIAPRVDQGEEQTGIYIGNSYKSNNLRMQNLLVLTLDLANNINRISKKVRDETTL